MSPSLLPQTTRWLALALPRLAIDRLLRTNAASPDAAFATYAKAGGAFRLAAVSPRAAAAGLHPGQPLADARAILPGLDAIEADDGADADLLDRLAGWCDRFTPVVVVDAPDGLLLEIAGSVHLFGGEAELMAEAVERLGRDGITVRAAIAPTPSAAAALARFDPGRIVEAAGLDAALARLPVEALRLPERPLALLRRLGLKRIGPLLDAPRQPLAARAGAETLRRLDQMTGRSGEALSPRRPPPPVFAAGRFLEPVTTLESVLVATEMLAGDLARRLDDRGAGVRRLRLRLFGVDGRTAEAAVGLSHPERDPAALVRLLRERLGRDAARFEAAFGFEAARLDALEIAPVILRPADLAPADGTPATGAPAAGDAGRRDMGSEARLVDALAARLDGVRVRQPVIAAAHLPERAARFRPAGGPLPPSAPPPEDGVMRRPLTLFSPPQPVEAMAGVPDGPPVRFRWRRVVREVVRAEGPERILPDWLVAAVEADRRESRLRDYYRVEDRDGRRYWLYREGLFGGTDPPRWFIHGVFG